MASTSRGRSPRVHKSAIKQAQPAEQPKSEEGAKSAATEDNKDSASKGKRKVTFDVQPEVAIIKDEGETGADSEQRAHSANVEGQWRCTFSISLEKRSSNGETHRSHLRHGQ